ncbi:MAG TPA: PilZ domain-containing protein [Fimbriimonadaceae bacterium]
MDAVFGSPNSLKVGSQISLVFYMNAQPVAVAASVVKQQPLTLTTTDRGASMLETGKRALLIHQDGRNFAKAEAQIVSCDHFAEGWRIETGEFGWEEVDRRRYPRVEIKIPIVVKAVLERNGSAQLKYVQGETVDLSLGGTWLTASDELVPGSLVEFQAELVAGENMRALAIVAWQREEGVGLEFVDFLGGSRYYLHNFLNQAA